MLRKHPYLKPSDGIEFELEQAAEEGKVVSIYKDRVESILGMDDGNHEKQVLAAAVYDEIQQLPVEKGYPYVEPSDLKGIRAEMPDGGKSEFSGKIPEKDKLYDKIYGAWLGRCAGCLLGQPIECWHRDNINGLLKDTGNYPFKFYISSDFFRPLLYIINIWKEVGWDTIIYLAVLSGINPEVYESSEIDGANRLQRAFFITWPELRGIVAVLLVLAVGNVMNAGFDQIINMYNAAVYDVSDIIDTYIYRYTFLQGKMTFGFSSAVGLFKSVINFMLLFGANKFVRLFGEEGLI